MAGSPGVNVAATYQHTRFDTLLTVNNEVFARMSLLVEKDAGYW